MSSDGGETSFFVEGIPAPQGSKRHVGRGRMIESSKKVAPWRKQVANESRKHFDKPINAPTCISILFVMPRPKSWGRKRQDPMVQRPDLDKLVRAVCDALTGVAIDDDSQITRIHAMKVRAEHDAPTGALITIKEVEE